jgi:hypothetical protein
VKGDDAGMDGAIADGEGESFPLVCTTGEDVIGNLTRSLASYLADGGKRRKVVVATSQHLSQRRRKNLEQRATQRGFTLVQIYDRMAFADRLYRSPAWCRELLGLTGHPLALSIIPLTQRPLSGLPLIGRNQDLAWLQASTGDRVVSGVPGGGKTSVLERYARDQEGLFVVDEDRGAIAAALRTQAPKRVIVDDAHTRVDLIRSLCQLRQELGASFEIVAACWPGQTDSVVEVLQIPLNAVRELELLTRDEIVQVIGAAGLQEPRLLVREIVNQADGRPGLAVTLTQLCLRGGIHELALADALSRSIRTTFEDLIGRQATLILAVLSVGGDGGMALEAVAKLLERPRSEIYTAVTDLAAGGVITPLARGERLVVRPAGLRHALVRDLFFGQVAALSLEAA